MTNYIKLIVFIFVSISLNSCGFIHYMNTKERVDKEEEEINDYLNKIKFKTYNYSLRMQPYFLDKLADTSHVLDLYKLERNTAQSTMQIRVYNPRGELITGYTQCYGNLNLINILRKEEFVRYDNWFNNYALNYKDEFDLFVITEEEKSRILNESEGKNRIVIYWSIWSNHFSKIMLKKTKKYIKKFDPDMTNTYVIIVNNDYKELRKRD